MIAVRNLVAQWFNLYTELPAPPTFGLKQAFAIVEGIRRRNITPTPQMLVPVRVAGEVFGIKDVFAGEAQGAIANQRDRAARERDKAEDLRAQASAAEDAAAYADKQAEGVNALLALFGEK